MAKGAPDVQHEAEGRNEATATPALEFSEPSTLGGVEVEVVTVAEEKKRRIVKLPFIPEIDTTRTMYLVENGKKRAIANSTVAAALQIPVEVVTEAELAAWPDGPVYTG